MASSQQTDFTQIVGMVKETYAKKLEDARLNFTILQDMFPLDEQSPIGNNFHVPVLLTQSQSTLYDLSGGTRTFPNPVAPQSADAQIPALEISERMLIPFGVIGKLNQGAQVSFVSSTTLKMLALNKAVKRQIEWSLLYGQSPVAQIASNGSSSTSLTFSLTAGSFGAGYLVGCENQYFDIFNAAGSTLRTATTPAQCTAVDVEANTITLTGTAADFNNVVIGDNLWRYMSRSSNGAISYEITGLATQIANTGTIFGINAANYSLFRGVTVAALGNLSVQKVLKMVAKARNRGADGDMVFLTSANGYAALLADLNAERRVDYTYSKTKMETGAESVVLHSSNGAIEIVEHPFVKDNDCFLLPKDEVMRPAVSDVTDNLSGNDLTVMSANSNSFEFRVWTSQASFLAAPAHAVIGQGVTYA